MDTKEHWIELRDMNFSIVNKRKIDKYPVDGMDQVLVAYNDGDIWAFRKACDNVLKSIKDVTYYVGQRIMLCHNEYIIALTNSGIILINIANGKYWSEAKEVINDDGITYTEMLNYIGRGFKWSIIGKNQEN